MNHTNYVRHSCRRAQCSSLHEYKRFVSISINRQFWFPELVIPGLKTKHCWHYLHRWNYFSTGFSNYKIWYKFDIIWTMYLSNGRLFFLPSKHIYGSRHSANVVHLSFSGSFHSFSRIIFLDIIPVSGRQTSQDISTDSSVIFPSRPLYQLWWNKTPNQTCIQSESYDKRTV